MFNAVGEQGLNQVIVKRLTTAGGSPAPAVAPELFPGITLENDRPEWGWLKGEFLYGRGGAIGAAGAGAHSTIVLSNGSTNRNILVVKSFNADVAFSVACGTTAGTTTATGVGQPRDSRNPPQSQGILIFGNILTAGRPLPFGTFPANARVEIPVIVSPGNFMMIHAVVDNLAMSGSIQWTERLAQPGELV